MSVEECLTALKKEIYGLKSEVRVQGEQIKNLTKTIEENFRKDIKELYTSKEELSERVVGVEKWQENFEKNQINRLAVLGIVIAVVDVIAVIAAFVIGRGT